MRLRLTSLLPCSPTRLVAEPARSHRLDELDDAALARDAPA
jgi:hypothetical protein